MSDNSEPRLHDYEFARLFHDSFANRQRYEWRINFSLWAAIALVSWVGSNGELPFGPAQYTVLMLVYALTFTGYCYLMLDIHRGNEVDKSFKHYFRDRYTNDVLPEKPDPENPIHRINAKKDLWYKMRCAFTALLLVASLVFTFPNQSSSDKTTTAEASTEWSLSVSIRKTER